MMMFLCGMVVIFLLIINGYHNILPLNLIVIWSGAFLTRGYVFSLDGGLFATKLEDRPYDLYYRKFLIELHSFVLDPFAKTLITYKLLTCSSLWISRHLLCQHNIYVVTSEIIFFSRLLYRLKLSSDIRMSKWRCLLTRIMI